MLTRISGFNETAVSPILLVFGGGLVIGNLAAGKFADRSLLPTVFGTLAVLAIVLAAMTAGLRSPITAVLFIGSLGAAGFATVASLQMWVLSKAEGAGQSLASSFNIAAFNLGNAIGAWAGGVVIEQTFRQVVRISLGGSRLRFVFSNAYDDTPLKIGGASVAPAGRLRTFSADAIRSITFGGEDSIVVPPGGGGCQRPGGNGRW